MSGAPRPRVLVVSPYLPYPSAPHGGGQRVWRLLKALAERYEVDLATYVRAEEAGEEGPAEALCAKTVLVPHEPNVVWPRPPGWLAKAFHLVRPPEPDNVLAFRSEAMARALAGLSERLPYVAAFVEFHHMALSLEALPKAALTILDTHEVRSAYLRHDAAAARDLRWKAYYLSQAWKTSRFEERFYPRFDVVLAVSEPDRARLAPFIEPSKLLVVPNGVWLEDFPFIAPEDRGKDTLLFVANLGAAHNVEGLLWFHKEVWPLIRSRVRCRLLVAASNVPPEIRELAHPGLVEIVGPVRDLSSVARQARCAIAPILRESGQKMKIPEALAFGLPVVATREAAAGVGALESVLVGSDAEEFAFHAIGLLEDDAAVRRLSAQARADAARAFDFRNNLEPVFDRLLEAQRRLDGRAGAPGSGR